MNRKTFFVLRFSYPTKKKGENLNPAYACCRSKATINGPFGKERKKLCKKIIIGKDILQFWCAFSVMLVSIVTCYVQFIIWPWQALVPSSFSFLLDNFREIKINFTFFPRSSCLFDILFSAVRTSLWTYSLSVKNCKDERIKKYNVKASVEKKFANLSPPPHFRPPS